MATPARLAGVGMFVLAGLLLFAIALFMIGERQLAFADSLSSTPSSRRSPVYSPAQSFASPVPRPAPSLILSRRPIPTPSSACVSRLRKTFISLCGRTR